MTSEERVVWVSALLTVQNHHGVLAALLFWKRNKHFLTWIVTCGDKWILYTSKNTILVLCSGSKKEKHHYNFQGPQFIKKKVMNFIWADALNLYQFWWNNQESESAYSVRRLCSAPFATLWKLLEISYENVPHLPYSPSYAAYWLPSF